MNINGCLGIMHAPGKMCILLGWFEEDADFLDAVINLRRLKTISDAFKKLFNKYGPEDFGSVTNASCNIADETIFESLHFND